MQKESKKLVNTFVFISTSILIRSMHSAIRESYLFIILTLDVTKETKKGK